MDIQIKFNANKILFSKGEIFCLLNFSQVATVIKSLCSELIEDKIHYICTAEKADADSNEEFPRLFRLCCIFSAFRPIEIFNSRSAGNIRSVSTVAYFSVYDKRVASS